MIAAIHQPQYLPYIGYLDKIRRSDEFVFLDDVQYKKNEWQNRNRIRNAKGWQWITVPVKYSFGQTIDHVKISNDNKWRKAHYKSLITNYGRALYFKDHEPFFKSVYENEWDSLSDINIYVIEYMVKSMGIETKFVKSSELKSRGSKSDKLIEICKELGADSYLSGDGGKAYLDLTKFEKEGIKVVFQNFKHPVYKQAYDSFIPYISGVDLLFNHGPNSLKILTGAGEENRHESVGDRGASR